MCTQKRGLEEQRGGEGESERGQLKGLGGKKCDHQLLAADPGRRLLDCNPAADV